MMRKFAALLLAVVFFCAGVTGCTKQNTQPETDSLRIVCTIFPAYDWVRAMLGGSANHVQLELLLSNGTDLHSYQPSAADIVKIVTSDVFIYVGGESDAWVTDVLKLAENKNQVVLNLMELIGDSAKLEETPEGAENAAEEEEPAYDEHVWLSLRNAEKVCAAVQETLCSLDSAHAAAYRVNTAAYLEKLNALDDKFSALVSSAKRSTLLFGDRFPFRYLAEDYGLRCYAAFVGCSSETNASFETIIRLAKVMDEQQLPAVLVTESSDKKIAKSVLENTTAAGQQILALDSLQSVTSAQIASGATYLSMMEANLEILRTALN